MGHLVLSMSMKLEYNGQLVMPKVHVLHPRLVDRLYYHDLTAHICRAYSFIETPSGCGLEYTEYRVKLSLY